MIIHFNGAAQTVTGSQFHIQVNGKTLLLDCGLYQGRWEDTHARNSTFRFDPARLDAVLLSHAHIDHSGNLPNLVKQGFKGSIYATPVTVDLTDLMLQDSGHIQESDAEYVNRRRARKGLPPVEPLYTQRDASMVRMHMKNLPYDQPLELFPGVTVTMVEAGHILGSASVVLDINEDGRKYRVWFSGDIGRPGLPLIRDPRLPEDTDYLIMESTYGDKSHEDIEAAYDELRDTVKATIKRGGKVIIPAFAVGRTQEIVYNLNRMMQAREIPSIPIFVDSPLAVNATTIFARFPQYFDDETHEFTRSGRHPALAFDQLTYVKSVDESKALNRRGDPMVILSASGMAESGRILHHLANNIEDPKNTVLIVSRQAPGTLGRELADRAKTVEIFGETYRRRAEVVTIGGFSAHAGKNMLVRYATQCKGRLKKLWLVHGEEKSAGALMQALRAQMDIPIEYPELYERVEI